MSLRKVKDYRNDHELINLVDKSIDYNIAKIVEIKKDGDIRTLSQRDLFRLHDYAQDLVYLLNQNTEES